MGTMADGDSASRKWAGRIGRRARSLRKLRGENLETIARRARLGIGALSDIENGKREARLNGYARLAKALGVPLADLLGIAARSPLHDKHPSQST